MAKIDELDYYRLLGVEPTATFDDIQRAFHAFARKYHPDAHRDDPTTFARYAAVYRRGTEAYRVLRVTTSRAAYDEGLREGRLRFEGGIGKRPSLKPQKG